MRDLLEMMALLILPCVPLYSWIRWRRSRERKFLIRGCLGCAVWLLFAIAVLVWIPNFQRQLRAARYTVCRGNLRALGGGLARFAADHGSQPPGGLHELAPAYLEALPTCPAAGGSAYSTTSQGDRYTVFCPGWSHRDAPGWPEAGFPQYGAGSGLYDRAPVVVSPEELRVQKALDDAARQGLEGP